MTRALALSVNGVPIGIDYFVQQFIDHVVGGIMEAMEGTGPVKTLDLSLDGGKVTIVLNGNAVRVNAFVNSIVGSTVTGMVLPLKGVTDVKTLQLRIER